MPNRHGRRNRLFNVVGTTVKVTWESFKAIAAENQVDIYQKEDADNLSYRLSIYSADERIETNVMKAPPGNPDLVDYENNYQPTVKTAP